MTKLELEIHDDVITTLNKIKNINDEGIDLVIPEGAVLFESGLNLMLLNKEAERMGKSLHFQTEDEAGLNLISSITDSGTGNSTEKTYTETPTESQTEKTVEKKKFSIIMPPIKMPNLSNFKFKTPLIAVAIVAILGLGGYALIYNTPKADIKITITSDPLTKSVSIKAKKDAVSDATTKILRGISISADTSQTQSLDTTGTKEVGTKAGGKVTIYNKTDAEKTFKKGAILTYNDFRFLLDDDVTIPARTDSLDSPPVITLGETSDISVTAEAIGSDSNISKDKTLSIKGYKTSEFTASSTETFVGGESKTVKIVAAKDLTDLTAKTLTLNQEVSQTALTSKLGTGQKLINGSAKSTISSEVFDAKVGDEKDKVSLTQTVTNLGLAYPTDELDKILESLTKGFVAEGFILSNKDSEINVEVLGNSDTTVLSPTEADLQVTLKTFVIPDIQVDKLRESLLGKNLTDAQTILGKVRNVKTYAIDIAPNIPFLQRVPQKPQNVNIEVITSE